MLQAVDPRTGIYRPLLGYREQPTEALAISAEIHPLAEAGSLRASSRLLNPATLPALCLTILVFAALLYWRVPLDRLGHSGYLGIVLPGLVLGVGTTLVGLTAYILGIRNGQPIGTGQVIQGGRLYQRFQASTRRWIGPSLFTFAILPGPLTMVSLWAGTTRYPLWRFLLCVTAGNAIKVTGLTLVGYQSLSWLLRPLG